MLYIPFLCGTARAKLLFDCDTFLPLVNGGTATLAHFGVLVPCMFCAIVAGLTNSDAFSRLRNDMFKAEYLENAIHFGPNSCIICVASLVKQVACVAHFFGVFHCRALFSFILQNTSFR